MARVAVELCLLLFLCGSALALNTIDTFKPIARLSPVRGVDTDQFGFSVAAHKLRSDVTGFADTLANTVIIVGAPLGKYPGGLDLPLNASVCELYDELRMVTRDRSALTDEEIRECYLRTGLVYSCPLTGTTGCGPVLGNMDAWGADGALFDRIGNIKQRNSSQQEKTNQRMGSTVSSSGEFFVACAPFWKYTGPKNLLRAPVGFCVFSGQNLQNFQFTRPCGGPLGSNNNKQLAFCMAGHSAAIRKGEQLGDSVLGVATPGRFEYSGGVYYYNDLTSTEPVTTVSRELELGLTRAPSVRAAIDLAIDFPEFDPHNVPKVTETLYGFASTVGKFNGSESSEYFFVSSPRYPGVAAFGRIYVVTDFRAVPNVTVDGDQNEEYFGFSIATADLNGDGYDDVVTGAPMYSKPDLPELGRIIILYNDKGHSLMRNQTIEGNVAFGRFGHSVTSLGDLNNDGCDDIAISAPFDDNGKVFIYYGSKSSGLINTTAQQTITAEQMINQVTNLSAITGFGFSLDGKVDIDGNQYRDLVVSAIGTSLNDGQAVFVLRSFPVANVELNITDLPDKIYREMKDCIVNNANTTCFNIRLCGKFTGKGLTSINPRIMLHENIVSRQRVFFDPADITKNTVESFLNLPSVDQQLCQSMTVYIVKDLTPDEALAPLNITFSLLPFVRSSTPVDTNFQPDDLVTLPVIKSSPVEKIIPFALDCGPDSVCTSDLVLEVRGVTYLDSSGNPASRQVLTAGEISRIAVNLTFRNENEDAFRPSLFFRLPSVFTNPIIRNLVATCTRDTHSEDDIFNYTCTGFPNPLRKTAPPSDIQLIWQVSPDIRGNEDSFHVPIEFRVNEVDQNTENATTLSDNMVMVNISVMARSVVDVQIPQRRLLYLGNQSNTEFTQQFPKSFLQYNFRNMGPSTIFNASLTLLLPFRVPNLQGRYFLYPFNITVSPLGSVVCSESVINPDRITLNSRRRRSIEIFNVLKRPVRQAAPITVNSSLDCRLTPMLCQELSCQITNVPGAGSVSINIDVILDERFYYNREQVFTLVTTAKAEIQNSFIVYSGSTLNTSATITISRALQTPDISLAILLAILLPAILAPIFLICLAVILYFCGFFRRKSKKKAGEDDGNNDDFEAFDQDAFSKPKLTGVSPLEEKPPASNN